MTYTTYGVDDFMMGSDSEVLESYYLRGLGLAMIRENLGGVKAEDSFMWKESTEGLLKLGWTKEAIEKAISIRR